MLEINYITVLFVLVFVFPIITAVFKPFSRERILYSLESLMDNVEFLAGLLLAIFITKKIFFESTTGVYRQIYELIPESIRGALYGQDVLTYIIMVPIALLVISIILRLITNPIYKAIIVPLSQWLYLAARSMSSVSRSLIAALWQLPRSIFLVLVLGLIINFCSYYLYFPGFAKQLNESSIYQVLFKTAIQPALNSNIAKQIPVIVNDSFRRTLDEVVPQPGNGKAVPSPEKLINQLTGGNVKVIEYFNGVTLDEAIISSPEIDDMAKKIVGEEKNSKKKALLLYKWVSRNIKYDYDKVQKVSTDPRGISSGSKVAYQTRKGICFDYSCLYISMCRAVGLQVRLVTGLAYSGASWGDHAWNQVFCSEENRWINVDTTFGAMANYFDKPDFSVDHKYDEIQGEW